eukprot:15438329-Alexandrium_andersonii.AAC.1
MAAPGTGRTPGVRLPRAAPTGAPFTVAFAAVWIGVSHTCITYARHCRARARRLAAPLLFVQ